MLWHIEAGINLGKTLLDVNQTNHFLKCPDANRMNLAFRSKAQAKENRAHCLRISKAPWCKDSNSVRISMLKSLRYDYLAAC